MVERLASGKYDQLHHFVAAGVWDSGPLEAALLVQADCLVGARTLRAIAEKMNPFAGSPRRVMRRPEF